MGTPDFAVASLDILVKHGYNVVAVITAPDKPAGRGLAVKQSAVKQYAVSKKLNVLQPTNLKSPELIEQLKSLNADLQVVVAFRMLPEVIWAMPPKGTFNLHASLLPQYRGAAPINWAIVNGEKETGVTTFFIEKEIDTGKIIFQKKTDISESDTAGTLHDKLMMLGAELVLKTVQAIEKDSIHLITQSNGKIKQAPKISREETKIDWTKSLDQIYNHIRGFAPYPAAWTLLDGKILKIYHSLKERGLHSEPTGKVVSDSKTNFKVAVREGYINILELQLEGKKKMSVAEFLRGYTFNKSTVG